MPTPDSTDLRHQLAAIGARFYQRGWMLGTAGNLSARLPDGTFWVTASGVDKGQMTSTDFLRMTVAGEVVEAPAGRRPSAETSLHQSIYGWSDTHHACLHVHALAANLLTRMYPGDIPLPPIEMLKGLGVWDEEPRVVAPTFTNHAHVPDIGAAVSARFADNPPQVPLFVIRDHGITVWGQDLREAANRVECAAYILDYAVQSHQLGTVWWG
ncbi:MAG: methylthioribulose 1-phosphate dehydratase [Myxococcota bacterium]